MSSLVPIPIPSFSMLYAEKREGLVDFRGGWSRSSRALLLLYNDFNLFNLPSQQKMAIVNSWQTTFPPIPLRTLWP